MSGQVNYITPEGFKKLQAEFQELFSVERPKLVETVAWAAGNGDRSENGDYIYGKRRLREIDKRLRFLSQRIESAQVIDPKTISSKVVVFGATVTVRDEDDQLKTYQIVGEDEVDVSLHKISWKSPLAKALLGKKVGDEAELVKPKSIETVELIELKF